MRWRKRAEIIANVILAAISLERDNKGVNHEGHDLSRRNPNLSPALLKGDPRLFRLANIWRNSWFGLECHDAVPS
jgi:hypothetical protein